MAPEFYAVADALRVRDVSALLDAMTRGEHLVLTLWVGNGCYPMPMRAVYDEGDSPTCGQRWHPCDAW